MRGEGEECKWVGGGGSGQRDVNIHTYVYVHVTLYGRGVDREFGVY